MDSKKTTTTNPSTATTTDTTPTTGNSNDIAQLLLNVLRQVQSEVRTTRELGQEATQAIARFRAISADLATTPLIDPQPGQSGTRP